MTKAKKHEGEVVEQEKASSKPKKIGSEIDEIFAGKKRKKLKIGSEIDEIFAGKKRAKLEKRNNEGENQAKVYSANTKSFDRKMGMSSNINSKSLDRKVGMSSNSKDSSTKSRQRKKTADGLTIYTEEELGVGKPSGGVLMKDGIQ